MSSTRNMDQIALNVAKHPELASGYEKKRNKFEMESADCQKEQLFKDEIEKTREIFKVIESDLNDREKGDKWLFGNDFTVADVILAVTLARLKFIGLSKVVFANGQFPLLNDYFNLLHSREDFVDVCIKGPIPWVVRVHNTLKPYFRPIAVTLAVLVVPLLYAYYKKK